MSTEKRKEKRNWIKFNANFTIFITSIKDSEQSAQQRGYTKTNTISPLNECYLQGYMKTSLQNIKFIVSYAEN